MVILLSFWIQPLFAERVSSVSIVPKTAELAVGSVVYATGAVLPSTAKRQGVWFTSSDVSVARVSTFGKIRAVGEGQASITVISADGYLKDSAVIHVVPSQSRGEGRVTAVNISPSVLTIAQGGVAYVTGVVVPEFATDQGVWFESSNTAVASVSDKGVVTAVSPGQATITAISADGRFEADARVSVLGGKYVVRGVSITPSVMDVTLGETGYVSGQVLPDTALNKTVWFKSSNESVATINSHGVVTAVGEGVATVSVVSSDGGYTNSTQVTVQAAK